VRGVAGQPAGVGTLQGRTIGFGARLLKEDKERPQPKYINSPQTLLFGGSQLAEPAIPAEVREMREWDESLLLSYEKDALGFYITGHPLAQFEKRLRKLVSHFLGQLDEEKDFNSEIRVAGIIGAVKFVKTKKDERMATLILEDLTGRIDVVAFPESFKRYFEYLREGNLVWVKGRFMGEGDNRRISLSEILPLGEAFQKQAKKVIIRVFIPGLEETVIRELKDILEKYPGECPVFFELDTPHSYRVRAQSIEVQSVAPSDELSRSVERLLGENSVIIEY